MQNANYVRDAFARIAPRYVSTNHVLSLGVDLMWRRRVAQLVEGWQPRDVLDLATGTGDLAVAIAQVCADARIVGADFCEPMLDIARRQAAAVADWRVEDACDLSFEDNSFDVVTVAFGLRNMADWGRALDEMHRVLRPGGSLLILDFSLPRGVLRAPYIFYLDRILPQLAGRLTGQLDAYEYLSGSIQQFPSGEAMCRLISKHHFASPYWEPLTGAIASIYTAYRPQ